MRTAVIALLAIALAVLAVASARHAKSPPRAALDVAFAGCADVVVEGNHAICVLDAKRTVRLAVDGNASDVHVRALGATASPERTTELRDAKGVPSALLRIVVPVGADALLVTRSASTFELRVRDADAHPAIDAANRARNAGAVQEAKALAEGVLQTAHSPHEAALAHGVLGRVALRAGDLAAAERELRRGMVAHATSAHLGAETEDAFALAFLLSQRLRRPSDASAVLDALAPKLGLHPEGAARLPLYRANIAVSLGDTRAALMASRATRIAAARLGLRSTERRAGIGEAHQLATIGDLDGARRLLERQGRELEGAADASACEKAEHFSELADLERLARRPDAEVRAGERVLSLTERDCPDVAMRTFALGMLAGAAAETRENVRARELLARARATMKEPRLAERIAWEDVDGRIALATGRSDEALAAFDRERALADGAALPGAAWQAAIGRGRALEASGRLDDAEAAYRDAESLLARFAVEIPLGEGRGLLLANRSASAGHLVDLLVRRGRARDALEVVRAMRVREIEAASRANRVHDVAASNAWRAAMEGFAAARQAIDNDAGRDWSRSDSDRASALAAREARAREARASLDRALALLGAPLPRARRSTSDDVAPGDLVLASITTPTATRVLLGTHETTTTFAIDAPLPERTDRATWAKRIFDGHEAPFDRATRVLVLTTGALRSVPIHALPFRGSALLAHALVVEPLDVEAPTVVPIAHAPALVVSDPTGDLAGAHREGDEVARALPGAEHLDGSRATASRLRERIASVDHFHYAGHAAFGGGDGMESALLLADGGRLEVGDVLGLSRAPRDVVLDACEAGRSDERAVGESFGLAQAFVLRGSALVLAPTRAVSDRAGLVLAKALYPSIATATGAEALAIARRALLDLARAEPDEWDAFALFVP